MRALTLAVAAGALLVATQANAGSFPVNKLTGVETGLVDTVAVQVYVHEGRRYCFYFDGWHGPGWYRCGFAWRRASAGAESTAGTAGVTDPMSAGIITMAIGRNIIVAIVSESIGSTTRSRTNVRVAHAHPHHDRCSKQYPRAEHRPVTPAREARRPWRCRCAIRRRRENPGRRKREPVHGRQCRRQRRWWRQWWRRRCRRRCGCQRRRRKEIAVPIKQDEPPRFPAAAFFSLAVAKANRKQRLTLPLCGEDVTRTSCLNHMHAFTTCARHSA